MRATGWYSVKAIDPAGTTTAYLPWFVIPQEFGNSPMTPIEK